MAKPLPGPLPSPRFGLSWEDGKTVVFNVILVAVSAVVTYLVIDYLPTVVDSDGNELVWVTLVTGVLKVFQQFLLGTPRKSID